LYLLNDFPFIYFILFFYISKLVKGSDCKKCYQNLFDIVYFSIDSSPPLKLKYR